MYITILNEGKKPDAKIKQRILKTNFSSLILGSGQDFCRGIQKQFNSWFRPLRHWAAMELQRRGSQLSTSRPVFGDGSIYLWHTYIHSHTRAHTHTCSELSLRIMLWDASYVQNTSITPDRNGSLKGPEKKLWSNHRHSQWGCIIVLSCANTHPIQTEMEKLKLKWHEMKLSSEGSRLSPLAIHTHWLRNNGIWMEASPEEQVITTVQVRQAGQIWYHRLW